MSTNIEVHRGILLLNEKDPGWWREDRLPYSIDLATLDMSSNEDCILGQLYGSYTNGLSILKRRANAAYYGFHSFINEWVEYIENRRIAHNSTEVTDTPVKPSAIDNSVAPGVSNVSQTCIIEFKMARISYPLFTTVPITNLFEAIAQLTDLSAVLISVSPGQLNVTERP